MKNFEGIDLKAQDDFNKRQAEEIKKRSKKTEKIEQASGLMEESDASARSALSSYKISKEQLHSLEEEFTSLSSDPQVKEYFEAQGIHSLADYVSQVSESGEDESVVNRFNILQVKLAEARSLLRGRVTDRSNAKGNLASVLRESSLDHKGKGTHKTLKEKAKAGEQMVVRAEIDSVVGELLSGREETLPNLIRDHIAGKKVSFFSESDVLTLLKKAPGYSSFFHDASGEFLNAMKDLFLKYRRDIDPDRANRMESNYDTDINNLLTNWQSVKSSVLEKHKDLNQKLDNEKTQSIVERLLPEVDKIFSDYDALIRDNRYGFLVEEIETYNGEFVFTLREKSGPVTLISKYINLEQARGRSEGSFGSAEIVAQLEILLTDINSLEQGDWEIKRKKAAFDDRNFLYRFLHKDESLGLRKAKSTIDEESKVLKELQSLFEGLNNFIRSVKGLETRSGLHIVNLCRRSSDTKVLKAEYLDNMRKSFVTSNI